MKADAQQVMSDAAAPLGWARGEWWRWWKVTPDGVLVSPIGSCCWETAECRAFCPHGEPLAVRRCWCGVYAFTSAADCRAHAHATKMFAAKLMDPAKFAGVVLGRVQLSADAFLAKSGPPQSARVEWMASACRITRLHTEDRELVGALAARYGVPVEDCAE